MQAGTHVTIGFPDDLLGNDPHCLVPPEDRLAIGYDLLSGSKGSPEQIQEGFLNLLRKSPRRCRRTPNEEAISPFLANATWFLSIRSSSYR
jgi:hypothetical protein